LQHQCLSSVGLPLLNGFVGEFLVLSGAFQSAVPHGMLFAILGSSGVIWGACYLLWMYQKVFYGQIHHAENKTLPDIDGRERISLVPLVVMAVIMGVVSPYWMKSIQPAVVSTMPQASGIKAQAQKDHGQDKADQKTVPGLPAAATIQKASATGGQK
jgi:NADH-quinone oxidoreductase subunit M